MFLSKSPPPTLARSPDLKSLAGARSSTRPCRLRAKTRLDDDLLVINRDCNIMQTHFANGQSRERKSALFDALKMRRHCCAHQRANGAITIAAQIGDGRH